ncbi:hypothetical protein Daqu01_03432 [Deinococcus aquaticus]
MVLTNRRDTCEIRPQVIERPTHFLLIAFQRLQVGCGKEMCKCRSESRLHLRQLQGGVVQVELGQAQASEEPLTIMPEPHFLVPTDMEFGQRKDPFCRLAKECVHVIAVFPTRLKVLIIVIGLKLFRKDLNGGRPRQSIPHGSTAGHRQSPGIHCTPGQDPMADAFGDMGAQRMDEHRSPAVGSRKPFMHPALRPGKQLHQGSQIVDDGPPCLPMVFRMRLPIRKEKIHLSELMEGSVPLGTPTRGKCFARYS